ncbi:hypothetical protein DM02DRAFT_629072 [Periconia macrospinosa]|uniref:Uncharacterized protein n=1 Tax=Periconia macrospinosa TaxID=97972 RepID=A0A2V1DNP5_9PLEO|nr:hypothetical protein DM02DRAFT_629072 [Periconia macrospinosa]
MGQPNSKSKEKGKEPAQDTEPRSESEAELEPELEPFLPPPREPFTINSENAEDMHRQLERETDDMSKKLHKHYFRRVELQHKNMKEASAKGHGEKAKRFAISGQLTVNQFQKKYNPLQTRWLPPR